MLSRIRVLPRAALYWAGCVGPGPRGGRILTLHGTPHRRAAELARQFAYLKRCWRVVPLARLVERLEARERVDGMLALTFDDGLRSNVEVAYPLLQRFGLPAIFFVCPRLVDERAWLWTHEARQRLRFLEIAWVEPRIEWLKSLDIRARTAAEARLRAATPHFAAGWEEHEDYDLAGWDELRRLDPALVSIGSHTLTHPMLRSLPQAALSVEVGASRRLLEQRLQRPIELFAYPNDDHNAAAREEVRRHYRAAVACGTRSVEPGADLHLLPRLHLPRGVLRLALRLHNERAGVGPVLTPSVRAA